MDIHKIIADYLRGDISKEDKEKLDKWLQENPAHQEQLSSLAEIWKARLDLAAVSNQKSEREKLWNRLNTSERQKNAGKRVIRFRSAYLKYAAAVIVLLSVGYLYQHLAPSEPQVVAREILRSNPLGQKSKIQLPDGSRVWLNADSKLSYTSEFSHGTRDLHLEGEAFFEVVKNPDVPFRVHTDDLIVTALGTSFNVNAFAGKAYEEVALRTGKVKVECRDSTSLKIPPGYLNPGEQAHFTSKKGTISVSKITETDPYGWKDGRISFHHASFREVTDVLARWYNVEFKVIGKMDTDWDYSATFENEVLENILESLKFSEKIEYKMNGSQIEIKFH